MCKCYIENRLFFLANKPLGLKVFIAGRNRLENDGAKALAQVFETLKSLEEVVMPQNGIYHVGVSALATALSANSGKFILIENKNVVLENVILFMEQTNVVEYFSFRSENFKFERQHGRFKRSNRSGQSPAQFF